MSGAFSAALAGIVDRVRGGGADGIDVDDVARLDGMTVLVTGASSGLGQGVAIRIAKLGASTVIAQRSKHDASVAAIRAASSNDDVRAYPLDLADPATIDAFVARLVEDDVVLDRVVLNAGVVPASARTTEFGLDVMVHVNFLGNLMLVDRLLDAGRLADVADEVAPRIVVVGSESHRSAPAFDPATFDVPVDYPTSKVIDHYGRSKLLLHTWVCELSRRNVGRIEVHHLCPGAVNSSIAREAPSWSKPLVSVMFRLFFQSPQKASGPVVWLAASDDVAGETGVYLHMKQRTLPSDLATDPTTAAALWDAAHLVAERIST